MPKVDIGTRQPWLQAEHMVAVGRTDAQHTLALVQEVEPVLHHGFGGSDAHTVHHLNSVEVLTEFVRTLDLARFGI
jgi:hypothetical protein